jgi:hypothetical protein
MKKQDCYYSIADFGNFHHKSCQQLELFPSFHNRQKPQIESTPGISPKERDRYRVMIGDKVVASQLNADDAAKLADLIKRKRLTPSIEFLEERGIVSEQAQLFLLTAIGGES